MANPSTEDDYLDERWRCAFCGARIGLHALAGQLHWIHLAWPEGPDHPIRATSASQAAYFARW